LFGCDDGDVVSFKMFCKIIGFECNYPFYSARCL